MDLNPNSLTMNSTMFNLGTLCPLTNRQVAGLVAITIAEHPTPEARLEALRGHARSLRTSAVYRGQVLELIRTTVDPALRDKIWGSTYHAQLRSFLALQP